MIQKVKPAISASLTFCTLLLLMPFSANLMAALRSVPHDLSLLTSTTLEERNISAYGDRTKLGYGYLKDITELLPEDKIFPITRYRTYARKAHIFLPGYRNQIDDRILVGIDLSPDDIREILIEKAQPLVYYDESGWQYSIWAFKTTYDYDSLTGFDLIFDLPDGQTIDEHIEISILESQRTKRSLGKWYISQNHSRILNMNLDEPITEFSINRGATPFVLIVKQKSASPGPTPKLVDLHVLGVKVDLRGYAIVHRDKNTFTALKTSFLSAIQNQKLTGWINFLTEIRDV